MKQQSISLIHHFVSQVQRRLNWHNLLYLGLWAAAIGGSAMLIVAGSYVWFGYTVPRQWYGAVLGCAILAGLIAWGLKWVRRDQAAHFIDQRFNLKDAVRSYEHFSSAGLQDGFYALQAAQAERQVAQHSPSEIKFRPAWSLVGSALLILATSIAMGFKGPSPAVIAEQERAQATLTTTSAVNEEMESLIKELEVATDDEYERELINPDQLREWVAELEATEDPREAMRQYAKLEQKINRAAESLQNRRDEQLLDRAALELKKDNQNRELADLLKQKKYEQAADELDKMTPSKTDAAQDRKLSERQKELAKLRAATRRMADAARQSSSTQRQNDHGNAGQTDRSTSKQRRASRSTTTQRQATEGSGEDSDSNDLADDAAEEADDWGDEDDRDSDGFDDLADRLQGLDQAVEELERVFMDLEFFDFEDGLDDFDRWFDLVEAELDGLGDELRSLARMRSASARLKKLALQCAQCQSSMSTMANNAARGGREAGVGTSDLQRTGEENPIVEGNAFVLKGIKGDGPSLTQIQEADSGTGVSGRRGQTVDREFQKQFESFVEREDIPEELKSGVKNYFLQIHQLENSSNSSANDVPTMIER